MAKVKCPLLSGDARGRIGNNLIFRRGGVVSKYFKPRNPNSALQRAQRLYFKEHFVASLTQDQADLLYAAITHLHDDRYSLLSHLHDARYLQSVPQQDHGGLAGLADDDHSQYLTSGRGDARYLQSVPQQDHGGLAGLADDDHSQYLNKTRGDVRYSFLGHEHKYVLPYFAHGLNGTVAAGATMALPSFYFGLNAVGYNVKAPSGGVVKGLRVQLNSTQPLSGTLVFTVMIADG